MSQDVDPKSLLPAVLRALGAELAVVAVDRDGAVLRPSGVVSGRAEPGADWSPFAQQLKGARSGSVQRWDGWLVDAEGQPRYVEHLFEPVPGSAVGDVLIVTRDLTAQKNRERDLQRRIDSLLSGVAHDLNNPMAILLAQTTLLQSRAESEDTRVRAGKIHAAAERAARIVRSFLDPAAARADLAVPDETRSAAVGQEGSTRLDRTLPSAGTAPPEKASDRDGASLSILIIDDDREVAEALADMLGLIGHETRVVDNAADALARAQDRSVDLVFADLRMPVIDGVDLYRRIVAHRPDIDGRFVLVSGDAAGALDAIRDGAPGGGLLLLDKPFSSRTVRAVLERALAGPAGPPDRN